MDFFARVIVENPNLAHLFSFGSVLTGKDRQALRQCEPLQKHAAVVMDFIGRGVRGLSDIESLILELRNLGQTHVRAGVSTVHYEMFYRNLMAAFAEALGDQWDDEIANAWGNIYTGMTTIMDAPEQLDETEPLVGWGLALATASSYIAFGSPFRLAGFTTLWAPWIILILDVLDLFAALVLLGDLMSRRIVRFAQLDRHIGTQKGKASPPGYFLRLKYRTILLVHFLHLERWAPWPRLDALILSSSAKTSQGLYDSQVGVSWLHAVGLVRVLAILRVFFMARCAENARILQQATKAEWRRMASMRRLIVSIVYVTHVSACVWCLVARVELGPRIKEAQASEFFPDPSLLLAQSVVLRSYLLAFYWAWANLSGTGNVESTPLQPLEILSTLLVHACGATLFAIATGHVVSMLEKMTEEEGKVGNDLSELRAFMEDCDLGAAEQERIMHGYIAQNLMHGESDDLSIPYLNDDVGRKLPSHFRSDLEMHARAVALRRRNPVLRQCSSSFLFSLANGIRHTRRLLPGDYLFKQGEQITRRFCLVDHGTLEVIMEDETVKSLERGDSIGCTWLVDATLSQDTLPSFEHPCEWSDWLHPDTTTAGASIRATSECLVASGLPSPLEIEALRRRFPHDFEIIEREREAAAMGGKKKPPLRSVVLATIAANKKNV